MVGGGWPVVVVDRNGKFAGQSGHPPLLGRVWDKLIGYGTGMGKLCETRIGFGAGIGL